MTLILLIVVIVVASSCFGMGQPSKSAQVDDSANVIVTEEILYPAMNQYFEKMVSSCNVYIKKHHPNYTGPLHFYLPYLKAKSAEPQIQYDNYYGTASFLSSDDLDRFQKTDDLKQRLGLSIHATRDIETTLKLIDYAILHEKQLEQNFWNIRSQEQTRTSHSVNSPTALPPQTIDSILSAPLSAQIREHLQKQPFENMK